MYISQLFTITVYNVLIHKTIYKYIYIYIYISHLTVGCLRRFGLPKIHPDIKLLVGHPKRITNISLRQSAVPWTPKIDPYPFYAKCPAIISVPSHSIPPLRASNSWIHKQYENTIISNRVFGFVWTQGTPKSIDSLSFSQNVQKLNLGKYLKSIESRTKSIFAGVLTLNPMKHQLFLASYIPTYGSVTSHDEKPKIHVSSREKNGKKN